MVEGENVIYNHWKLKRGKFLKKELREHIEGYYKKLSEREDRGGLRLEENF
jgi:hypothetical protein